MEIFRRSTKLLAELQMKPFSTENVEAQHLLNIELDSLLDKEEIMWHQKNRLNRLALGERNTKFFHMCTRARHSINRIDSIFSGTQWIFGHENIANHVFQTFFNQFNPEPIANQQQHINSFLRP